MKLYLGMALTQAPEEFREKFCTELKAALAKQGSIELLEFIGLTAGTSADVYHHDRACTEEADLCLFVVDHPSIGLGMEIMIRQAINKPMIVCAHKDAEITRMLLGMCEANDIPFIRYTTVEEICSEVQRFL